MIPIFIITCDRLKVLEQSIQSYYDNIKMPFEIVIIDLGSTYEPTREFLRHLTYEGKKVYWEERIKSSKGFNSIDKVIQDYFKGHSRSNYVVTDPDIALDNVKEDVLAAYTYLLEVLPNINVVGPMLRIDDIPDYYPLKKRVLLNSRHRKFHSWPTHVINYKGQKIKYIFAKIDTTFGMFRAGTQWRRLQEGIRTFAPYSARHLDWYVDPKNMSKDQQYYIQHASPLAHWSKWG